MIRIIHRRGLGDAAALQTAVNAYAAIGRPASCATYVTSNQGGTIVNDACQVEGSNSWHDANLSAMMTPAQLQATLDEEQNPGAVYGGAYVQAPGGYAPIPIGSTPPQVTPSTSLFPLFGAGAPADTKQVGATVSTPTIQMAPASAIKPAQGSTSPASSGAGNATQTAQTDLIAQAKALPWYIWAGAAAVAWFVLGGRR
jgi:hypothetical protein